jgi:geranylgeranyl diphosphate synthase, type II
MTHPDLRAFLEQARAEVDAALVRLLPTAPACPEPLAGAMRYSVTAGGKRLRPLLCLASADAVGGAQVAALPAACAIELIHTYSLVHDDLPAMDNDTLRRGQPTLHVVAGEGMAILAGDGLLTEAFHLLAREPDGADTDLSARKLRVLARVALAAGPLGMVAGQAIDLASVAPGPGASIQALDAAAVADMHARKTGALIRAAAVAGAIMGGGAEPQIEAIDRAATDLGLAFQIVDDVLDVEGAPASLGKTPGKDAAAGKPTYPALYGLAQSKAMAADCLARAEAVLRDAGLGGSHLPGIGRWIVERSH